MKYINKKLGLAAVIYAATSLAMPALANQAETSVQPINLEQATTLEQIKGVYKQKLTEYSQDKKIDAQEIKNLYNIVKKGRELDPYSKAENEFKKQHDELTQQIIVLDSEKEELSTTIENLEKKIKLGNEEIVRIEEESKGARLLLKYKQDFENLRKELDDVVLKYYPGLIKETTSGYNLNYNAGDQLSRVTEEALFPLIKKAMDIFQDMHHPKRKEIEYFWHRQITIHEMITFRELILESTQNIQPALKEYNKLKKEKSEMIQQLEQEKNQTEKKFNPQIKTLEGKITGLEQKLSGLEQENQSLIFSSQKLIKFESYIEALEKKEEFVKDHIDASEYWIPSVLLGHKLGKETKEDDPKYNFKTEVSMLESLLDYEGLEVKVADIKNPTSMKYNPLAAFFMGVGFAYLRNLLLAPFIIRRKIDMLDITEPLLMSVLGLMFLDGIHPLVFPLRLVGMPFVMEPIRRLTGWRKVK